MRPSHNRPWARRIAIAFLALVFSSLATLHAMADTTSDQTAPPIPCDKYWVSAASTPVDLATDLSVHLASGQKAKDFVECAGGLSNVVLYLDGYPMRSIPPRYGPQENQFIFRLDRTENADTQRAWSSLLGGVRASDQQQYGRIISVSVGYGDKPLRSDASTRLRPIRWFAALFFIIGLSLALLALLFLAWRSNLIRDIGPDPVSKDNKRLFRDKAGNLFTEEVTSDGKRTYKALDGLAQTDGKVRPVLKTFSLARTQLAFWVFVTVAAFFYIWLVTTDRQSLPTFVLGLLGISSATAVGSTLIDSSRLASQPDPDSLKQQLKALRDEQTTLQAKATRSQDEESRLNTLNTQIPGLEATIAQGEESKVTKGFWRDILSDDTGITIHRFQIVAWTLVLGTIFVITVINTLIMPNYDGTLLALMGISSGAFIALKPTENQSDPTKK